MGQEVEEGRRKERVYLEIKRQVLDEILHPDREERVSVAGEGGVRRRGEGSATAAEGVDSCLRLKWFGWIFLEALVSSGVPPRGWTGGAGEGWRKSEVFHSSSLFD